ncbi:hypothetical protein HNP38_002234 [Chryseobacterium defluvii]|uniref:Uncharacterized protein n=1 Tax=Chryseobacterium defluvii TaxID=160396 RepID=A0A840KFY9_9FLAO|nr:hypothetical protein [Chryseobacterium defluvii]MBB4806938.1 hypothetical protein [Chryseobacterium defluvii]
MDEIILKYSFSPGFMDDIIAKELLIFKNFDTRLEFFWYFDAGFFPDNDWQRKQQRRCTKIRNILPQELQNQLVKLLESDLKIIEPEIIKTDKIIYATSAHPKSEYYKIKIGDEEKTIHIPYDIDKVLIEKAHKKIFLDFHYQLQTWIDQEFEVASEGKAVRFNKK